MMTSAHLDLAKQLIELKYKVKANRPELHIYLINKYPILLRQIV